MKQLSEFLADDLAVAKTGNAKQYATLLVKLQSAAWQPGLSAFSNRQLKTRIVRLVAQPPARKRSPLFFWLFFLLSFPLTGFSARQVVETEMRELQTYAYMSNQYQEKGTTEFCKRCTYESGEQIPLFSLVSP